MVKSVVVMVKKVAALSKWVLDVKNKLEWVSKVKNESEFEQNVKNRLKYG